MSDSLNKATRQYLARYAELEARQCWGLATHDHALVVPVRQERAQLLDGFRAAFRRVASRGGRALLVLVVNARRGDSAVEPNRELCHALRADAPEPLELPELPGWLLPFEGGDLLLVDRSREGTYFRPREGVGLARKIGCDILLRHQVEGKLRSAWLCTTDADAELPVDYFDAVSACQQSEVAAQIMPFMHVLGDAPRVHELTELYELWFRYYVEGLRSAGSPYAFHALGSVMALRGSSYAAVRGFSKRLAGEDYYTLDKLGKVGEIFSPESAPVRIRSRVSSRAPFGTGPRVAELLSTNARPLEFNDPRTFQCLGYWLTELARFATDRDAEQLQARVSAGSPPAARALTQLGAFQAVAGLRRVARDPLVVLTRVYGWFDGLRSLRFLHLLQDEYPPLSCAEALARGALGLDVEDPGAALRALRKRRTAEPISVLRSARQALADVEASTTV